MRVWYRRQHVYVQLALACLASAVLLLAFFSFTVKRASETARATLAEYGESMTEQLSQTVNTNYASYSKILRLISYDKDVQSFLLNKNDALRVDLHSALKRALIEVATLSASITDIVVEDAQGRFYNLADSLSPMPQMSLSSGAICASGLARRAQGTSGAEYIVIGKAIHSIDSYNQTNLFIGNVYLVLASSAFAGDARTDADAALMLFLTDGEDNLLFANAAGATQASLDALLATRESAYYFAMTALERTGYRIYAIQPEAESLFSASGIQWEEFATLLLLTLLLLLIWLLFARNLVSPLRRLRRFIARLRSGTLGEMDMRVQLSGYREAEVIGTEFNQLLDTTRRLTDELVRKSGELYESQLLQKQSELSSLRSQINPHFLYNTLETMVGIAYTNDQPEIAAIARALSLIFKFSIKGDSIVPLRTEFKIAMSYIDIQHYRFSDRFDVSSALPKECEDILVPKLILQPLIENAVVHGIEQHEGFCHLSLSARLEDDRLLLTIADDGAGIDTETLARLNERLESDSRPPQTDDSHIGILNVHSRIRLQYGVKYGLRLASEPGRGTTVTLTLPATKETTHV